MYDFSEQPGGARHPQLNFTRQIDTKLANGLQTLPEFANAEQAHLKSLAVRNLLRGRLLGLPTGQDVAEKLGVTPLTPAEVASGPHSALVTGARLRHADAAVVLHPQGGRGAAGRAAARRGGQPARGRDVPRPDRGERALDPEAGRLEADPAGQNPDQFTMNDLLLFVNDLNPLGDAPKTAAADSVPPHDPAWGDCGGTLRAPPMLRQRH